MFKHDWEHASNIPLSLVELQGLVHSALPECSIEFYQILSGGAANQNYKLQLAGMDPLLLRLYVRDSQAAMIECQLAARLQHAVPVPKIYKTGHWQGRPYAIMQFMPGIPLSQLLISKQVCNLRALMYQVGTWLANISAHRFTTPGFFSADLQIVDDTEGYWKRFMANYAANPVLMKGLSSNFASIKHYLQNAIDHVQAWHQCSLVHGDFSAENILVSDKEGVWSVTAILDWEWACSGSTMWDVANMLRYADQLPGDFQQGLLEGLEASGYLLPANWKPCVDQLNMLSLVELLMRTNPSQQPKRYAAIIERIQKIYVAA